MKKASRITFRKAKQQYDILMIKGAYILAERELIEESSREMSFTPESHYMFDAFGNPQKPKTEIEVLDEQMTALEQYGAELLEKEDYKKLAEVKKTYEKLIERWKQLNK